MKSFLGFSGGDFFKVREQRVNQKLIEPVLYVNVLLYMLRTWIYLTKYHALIFHVTKYVHIYCIRMYSVSVLVDFSVVRVQRPWTLTIQPFNLRVNPENVVRDPLFRTKAYTCRSHIASLLPGYYLNTEFEVCRNTTQPDI